MGAKKKSNKDTKTTSFWVFVQTTHVVIANPTLECGAVSRMYSVLDNISYAVVRP